MKVDMHIHSRFSFDGIMEPRMILSVAKKRGLRGVGIVDHNSVRGGLSVVSHSGEDLFVIVGTEVSTEKGDIVGLFLWKDIESRLFSEVTKEIKEQGGIVVLPHPHRFCERERDILNAVDAIEGFNARRCNHANAEALQMAIDSRLPTVGGSDAHFYLSIGHGFTEFDEDVSDLDEIRSKILLGDTKIGGKAVSQFTRFIDMGIGYSTKCVKRATRGPDTIPVAELGKARKKHTTSPSCQR
jgi:hypothetical protein